MRGTPSISCSNGSGITIFLCASLWFYWAGWESAITSLPDPYSKWNPWPAQPEQLAQPGESPIILPDTLHDLENQLNAARERALRDARAAREAEQRKNDLVVYLAHDLKTPLTSVIGYLTLLRDEPQLPAELRSRYTGIALDKAERLEDLINEFFDITRFNLSHLELEKRPVDLNRMLHQVVSEFQPMLAEKSMTCHLALPDKLSCSCDPDKLARGL